MTRNHPKGLSTLFFTEMWERASYYGMRALLVLFLASAVSERGMGMDDKTATAIYGIYTASVYLFALPGGWMADRLLGLRGAVWYGGLLIAAGHFCMALPWRESFFFGLAFIVLGTGLLKPAISSMVGELYPEGGARRDAGYSIYYMGINLGAMIGPFVCGYLGEEINWHYGFAASGLGMVAGLIQFRLSGKHLGDAGIAHPVGTRKAWWAVGLCTGALLALLGLVVSGQVTLNAVEMATFGAMLIAAAFVVYFGYIYLFGKLDATERARMRAAFILFAVSALFWAGYEQSGSSFNLFAERYTDRMLFGWEMPAGWLLAVPPLSILVLSPFFAALWMRLAWRGINPSSTAKFSLSLVLMGLAFAVMALAAHYVAMGQKVLPYWLALSYILQTTGELCLSPIGLSLTTQLAPKRFAAQVMGLWFLALSMGNMLAGLLAGRMETVDDMPGEFLSVFAYCIGAALLLLLLKRLIQKWMGGIP